MLIEAEKIFEEVLRLNACIEQYNNVFLFRMEFRNSEILTQKLCISENDKLFLRS